MTWGKKWSSGRSSNFSFRFKMPNIFSKTCLIVIALCVVLAILLFVNVSTGNYVSILEGNRTTLKNRLKTCDENKNILNSNLNACNSNLGTCNENLEKKSSSLLACQNEKVGLSTSYSSCNSDLKTCENDLSEYESDYNSCQNDLDDLNNDIDNCEHDLSDCQSNSTSVDSNYNALKTNYAKDYCCLLNKTHYSISSNKITCGDSGTTLTC